MEKLNLNNSLASSYLLHISVQDKNKIGENIMEAENKYDIKYKTELCQKFQTTGKCPYRYKCKFAHGKH